MRTHFRFRPLAGILVCTMAAGLPACVIPGAEEGDEVVTESSIDPNQPPVAGDTWYRPTVDSTWQWQLQPSAGGGINTGYEVDVYDIDLFNTSAEQVTALQAAGRRVIAYFSAGSYEGFRSDAGAFDAAELGTPLADFPDERWLDIRSANVRQIMLARLDLAVAKGFDAVEPDNVDGYVNDSGFDLTAEDQLAFNRFIANAARERGLGVGLKNDLDQIPALVEYFDFAVNEQCHEYDECELLAPFLQAGKPVFNAEYAARFRNTAAGREALCDEARSTGLRTLILPLDLDDSFRFSCD